MFGALFTRKRIALIALCAVYLSPLSGQAPATDLYLFKLSKVDTLWTIHSPKYLSGFNPGGYTNQPEFITDDLLYVSVQKAGDVQSDIYGLHLASNAIERITDTPESEYSPTLTPDHKHFTCIRQKMVDTVDQRLFQYPLDRSDNGEEIFENIYDVGYHAWLSPEHVAIFRVTDPPTLSWADVPSEEIKPVLSNIGRCLKRSPDGLLLYVHKYTADVWYLKSMTNPESGSDIIIEVPKDREDFTVARDGTVFMADGGIIYSMNLYGNNHWRIVADLSVYGLTNITRLAINGQNDLAVVNTP